MREQERGAVLTFKLGRRDKFQLEGTEMERNVISNFHSPTVSFIQSIPLIPITRPANQQTKDHDIYIMASTISSQMMRRVSSQYSRESINGYPKFSRRMMTSKSSSSSTSIIQNLAIFAVAGGLGYGAVTLFNSSDTGDNSDDGPVPPSAPITSRVYFDINMQNQPLGRIVIGLYGSTTPKTAQNFETLCKGTTANGRQLGYV